MAFNKNVWLTNIKRLNLRCQSYSFSMTEDIKWVCRQQSLWIDISDFVPSLIKGSTFCPLSALFSSWDGARSCSWGAGSRFTSHFFSVPDCQLWIELGSSGHSTVSYFLGSHSWTELAEISVDVTHGGSLTKSCPPPFFWGNQRTYRRYTASATNPRSVATLTAADYNDTNGNTKLLRFEKTHPPQLTVL